MGLTYSTAIYCIYEFTGLEDPCDKIKKQLYYYYYLILNLKYFATFIYPVFNSCYLTKKNMI